MIDQNEIDNLKKKFPKSGPEGQKFSSVIIRKLLMECETFLEIIKECKCGIGLKK